MTGTKVGKTSGITMIPVKKRMETRLPSFLRFAQVSDNRLHLRLQKRAASRIVVHRLEFFYQHGTTVYPSVEGLPCGFGFAQWLIKQSQLGFAINSWNKHF